MCSSKVGTSTTTPTCPAPQVIQNGTCVASCSPSMAPKNGYCVLAPPPVPIVYAEVFEGLIAATNGGYRASGVSITDGSSSSTISCGYGSYVTTNSASFRALLEQTVVNAGGTVNVSTQKEWCGTAGGETNCVKQIDNAIVVETQSSAITSVQVHLPGLLNDRLTTIKFDNKSNKIALISSRSKDAAIVSGSCSNAAQPSPLKDAINGNWTGYEFTYSTAGRVGLTSPSGMSCASQSCTFSSGGVLPPFDFSSTTFWRTSNGASTAAGAVLSTDLQLLSMFVCNSPLDEAKTFQNCRFFSLKRLN